MILLGRGARCSKVVQLFTLTGRYAIILNIGLLRPTLSSTLLLPDFRSASM